MRILVCFLIKVKVVQAQAPCTQWGMGCEPNWYAIESNAIGVIQTSPFYGNKLVGTGFLLANKNDYEQIKKDVCNANRVKIKHYFLSCMHIFDQNQNALLDPFEVEQIAEYSFYFDYRLPACGSDMAFDPNNLVRAGNARLLLYSPCRTPERCEEDHLDYVLLELSDFTKPEHSVFQSFYVGIDLTPPAPFLTDANVCIHHPRGRDQKINKDRQPFLDAWPCPQDYHLLWASGKAQKGSSGSPLFNAASRSCIAMMYASGKYALFPGYCDDDASFIPLPLIWQNGLQTLLDSPTQPTGEYLPGIADFVVTLEGNKQYVNEARRLASTQAIQFPPNMHLIAATFELTAPSIGYSENVGNTDQLYLENGSQVKIHAGGVNMSHLTVGGYEEGSLVPRSMVEMVVECETAPSIQSWSLRERATVDVRAAGGVDVGLEWAAVALPALSYAVGSEVTIISKKGDIRIFQPIDCPVPTWMMEEGYVRLYALGEGKGVYFRPGANLPQLQLKLAARWDIQANAIQMQSAMVEVSLNGGLMMRGNLGEIFNSRIHVPEYSREISMAWWRGQLEDVIIETHAGMINMGASMTTNGATTISISPSLPPNNLNLAKPAFSNVRTLKIAAESIQLGPGEMSVMDNAGLEIKGGTISLSANMELRTFPNTRDRITFSSMSPPDLAALNQKVTEKQKDNTFKAGIASRPDSLLKNQNTISPESNMQTVAEKQVVLLPDKFALSPYPNPFNARMAIQVDVPEESDVQVMLCNMRGEQVVLLYDGLFPAGRHRLSWDAAQASSGVYLCIMSSRTVTGSRMTTKSVKLTLVK